MKLTEEQIQSILEEATPSVIEGIKKELHNDVVHTITQEAKEVIAKYVREWVVENIIPEIQVRLVESKSGLVSAGMQISELIIDSLAQSATTTLKTKLESSWGRKKIFEALFS